MINYIRWVLSVALLYGVYTETGPWTTLALAFVMLSFEINAYFVNITNDTINRISGRLQRELDEHEDLLR